MASRLLLLLLMCSLVASCYRKHENVDLVIDSKEDIVEMKKAQKAKALVPESVQEKPVYRTINGIDAQIMPEYRLGPGDILEAVYHIEYAKEAATYKISIQDRLNINFPFHPQFSSSVLVRSDGRVSLPLVGDIMAADRTTEELTSTLNSRYSKYIRNPNLTVSLQEFNVKIDELKRAITTAPRGQSKIAPVAPDGRISFPIIGNLQAAGLSLRELQELVNLQYTKYISNLQVTLILDEIRHQTAYIFGEVNSPGAYQIMANDNILDIFAYAKGFTQRANRAQVLVFRSDGLKEPLVFVVDVQKMLKEGMMLKEMRLHAADVIYVPEGWLDEANDVIAKIFTRGIYAIVPFQSGISVNYDLGPGSNN